MRRRAVTVALAAAALLAGGCGDDDASDDRAALATATAGPDADAAARRAVTVQISSFDFLPARVTVAARGRVTWVNQDKAPHTAENKTLDGPAEFETGRLDRGDRRSVTFAEPGTYKYYCVFHRFMEAAVIVK